MPETDQSPITDEAFVFFLERSVGGILATKAWVGSKKEKAILCNLEEGIDFKFI